MWDILKHLRRNLRAEAFFAILMMAATSLGFVKVVAVAWILPAEEFGYYISVLGIASFVGIFSTLGRIEPTYKYYPILALRGQIDTLYRHALGLVLGLALRLGALGAAAALGIYILASQNQIFLLDITTVVLITCIAFAAVTLSLMASIVRAIDAQNLMPRFTLLRGGIILILTLAAAILAQSWTITLIGEGLGMVLTFCLMFMVLRKRVPAGEIQDAPQGLTDIHEDQQGGRLIYLAAMITASIPFGGRAAILVLAGPTAAGAFGLLTIIAQIGQMLAGVISQKLGVDLIKEEFADQAQLGLVERFGLPILFLWVVAAGTFLALAFSFQTLIGAEFWARYDITIFVVFLATLQMATSAFLFFHFAVMSQDREWDLVWAGLFAVGCFYGGFWISWAFDVGLWGYVASAAVANALHTGFLALRYVKRRNLKVRSVARDYQ